MGVLQNERHAAVGGKETLLISAIVFVLIYLILSAMGPRHRDRQNVPDDQFSAARAFLHVQNLAKEIHPLGSGEDELALEYIVRTLNSMGVSPEIEVGIGTFSELGFSAIGRVRNVVARVNGYSSLGTILVVGHYDSVPTGPGASDNAASIAAMLEVIRVLKQKTHLKNDVTFLFSDGEEMGLLGAEEFVHSNLLPANVAAVLNFDFRGNHGSVQLFETSGKNERLIESLAPRDGHVQGSSLLAALFKIMPNETDFRVFKSRSLPGMNFAAGEGYSVYHSALDNVEGLDLDTLQNEGEVMLAAISGLGNQTAASLSGSSDSIYFTVPYLGLIHYSEWPWMWIFSFALAASLLFFLALSVRFKTLRLIDVALSVLIVPAVIIGLSVACELIWVLIYHYTPRYQYMVLGTTYEDPLYAVAFPCIETFGFLVFTNWMLRRLPLPNIMAAVAIWLLIALAATLKWLPGASYILVWPGAGMLILSAAHISKNKALANPRCLVWLSVLICIPGLIIYTQTYRTLFVALTPNLIALPAITLGVFLFLSIPSLISLVHCRPVLMVLIASSGTIFVAGSALGRFDDVRRRPTSIAFQTGPQESQGRWISTDNLPDDWTKEHLGPNPAHSHILLDGRDRMAWVGPWTPASIMRPAVEILGDNADEHTRTIDLRIKSRRDAFRTQIDVSGPIRETLVAGYSFPPSSLLSSHVDMYALSSEWTHVQLVFEVGKAAIIDVTDSCIGIPQSGFGKRPSNTMSQPLSAGDITMATMRISLDGARKGGD